MLRTALLSSGQVEASEVALPLDEALTVFWNVEAALLSAIIQKRAKAEGNWEEVLRAQAEFVELIQVIASMGEVLMDELKRFKEREWSDDHDA